MLFVGDACVCGDSDGCLPHPTHSTYVPQMNVYLVEFIV